MDDTDATTAAHSHVRAIARMAYIFVYPLVMSYGDLYAQAIDVSSPSYSGGFGTWRHRSQYVAASNGRSVDVLYSTVWLDVRTGPLVVRLPCAGSPGGSSTRIADLWGFTLDESTLDNSEAADEKMVMLTAPKWMGEIPTDVDRVVRGESSFLRVSLASDVESTEDRQRARERHRALAPSPMSAQRDGEATMQPPPVEWLPWNPGDEITNHFWSCANFALSLTAAHPSDAPVLDRIAEIGVVRGEPWDPAWLSVGMLEAISAGMDDALSDLMQAAQAPLQLGHLGLSREATDADYFGHALGALVDPTLSPSSDSDDEEGLPYGSE